MVKFEFLRRVWSPVRRISLGFAIVAPAGLAADEAYTLISDDNACPYPEMSVAGRRPSE